MSFSELLEKFDQCSVMLGETYMFLKRRQMEYCEGKNMFFVPSKDPSGLYMSFDVKILTPDDEYVTLNVSHPIDIGCQIESIIKISETVYDDESVNRFDDSSKLLDYIRNSNF